MKVTQLGAEDALIQYNPDYWRTTIDPGIFPLVNEMEMKLFKVWQFVEGGNYIWIDGNDKEAAMRRYIRCLDVIAGRASEKLPHNVVKMTARVFTRYRLRPELLNLYEEKDGFGHASYNRVRNSMRFVPEFFRRFGVIRFGRNLIPEFHKTCIHEYGHMLWHQWLNEDEKLEFLKLIPPFQKSKSMPPGWYRPSIIALTGEQIYSDFVVPEKTDFISLQELMSPKECFAETFALYTFDPTYLKEKFPKRFAFIENSVDTDHTLMTSSSIQKAVVRNDGSEDEVTDLIPIDLQFNEARTELAEWASSKLLAILGDHGLSQRDVDAAATFGPYSSDDNTPRGIRLCALVKKFPQEKLNGDHYSFEAEGREVILFTDEAKYHKFLYDQLELASKMVDRQGATIQKKLAPDEIDHWYTTPSGQHIPVPKRQHTKPHRSLLLPSARRRPLPMGHAAVKPSTTGLKLLRPVQTKYVMQEHLADKAGKHYDFRIKVGGLAHSWAIPKGLPKAGEKRLAVLQPPHKVSYMGYEGLIPSGYGAGTVKIAEAGKMEISEWGEQKKIFSILDGKNAGMYAMVKGQGENWYVIPVKRKEVPLQYKPKDYRMRARKRMLISRRYAVQPWYGGTRAMIYTGDKENRILTRTESKKGVGYVDRTDNYPHLRDYNFGSSGSAIEVELFTRTPEVSRAVSISSPGRSRQLQRQYGRTKAIVRDIASVENEDVRKMPYHTRMKMVKHLIPVTRDIKKVPTIVSHKDKAAELFLTQHQGFYVVDRKAPYDHTSGLLVTRAEANNGQDS